jgi:hypothetical protein
VCASTTSAPSSPVGNINFGGQQISSGDVTAKIAFWRWSSGVKSGATCAALRQPHEYDPASNLLDYEFEGNLNDSSGNSVTASATSPVYTSTPVYPPSCSAGPAYGETFRAGAPAVMSGSGNALDGGSTVTYFWQQIPSLQGGLQNAVWSSRTSATPSVTGLVFGPFNAQLTVAQSNGQSTTCSVHDGVVATDSSGNIVLGNILGTSSVPGKTNADLIFGPMLRNGLNPWLWIDQMTFPWAQHFGLVKGTTAGGFEFTKPWETALTGTIDVSIGSTAVLGHGTSFGVQFCGGSPPCAPPPTNIWWCGTTSRRRCQRWLEGPLSGSRRSPTILI